MKQYIWMKVIAAGLALAALLFGISIMDTDPTLRVQQDVSMADIEAGKMPPDGKKVRITDAWLLPTWVVEYSHSRKRGDHAHVTVGLGSRETFERAAAGQTADVKLWLRLPQDFRTREGAATAMNDDALYLRQQPREGVINALPDSVRENIKSGGPWTSSATMRLEEGATPSSQGDGVGLVAAGVLALLLVAAWVAVDHANQGWLRDLSTAGATPFQGASRWLLAFGIALLGAPWMAFFVAGAWVDAQELNVVLLGWVLALLALAGWALWRHRVAFVVTPQGLDRASRSGTQPLLRWDEVDALSIAQRNFRGSVSVSYTLHAGERKAKVGNSLFAGGVDRYKELGALLRDEVNRRVAPPLFSKIASGARVAFGALGAHRDGLVKGRLETGELLPWADIDSANFADGKLKIKRKGKLLAWDSVALGKVRNPDVLIQLIEQRGLAPAAA